MAKVLPFLARALKCAVRTRFWWTYPDLHQETYIQRPAALCQKQLQKMFQMPT